MRMLRDLGFPVLASLAMALGLATQPAEGQVGAPGLAPARDVWQSYLTTPASGDETAAEPGIGANVWYWAGIGAATFGVGGAFSYYVTHDFFAHPPAAPRGRSAPAAPGIRGPGPVPAKPGQSGDTNPPNPPKDGGETAPDSSSTVPTDPPTDTQPGDGGFTEPPPPKTVPGPPPDSGDDLPVTVTPEPSTLVLLMSGVLAFLFVHRRRRRA